MEDFLRRLESLAPATVQLRFSADENMYHLFQNIAASWHRDEVTTDKEEADDPDAESSSTSTSSSTSSSDPHAERKIRTLSDALQEFQRAVKPSYWDGSGTSTLPRFPLPSLPDFYRALRNMERGLIGAAHAIQWQLYGEREQWWRDSETGVAGRGSLQQAASLLLALEASVKPNATTMEWAQCRRSDWRAMLSQLGSNDWEHSD